MKRFGIIICLFLLVPLKGFADGKELRKYRFTPKQWKPLPYLLSAPLEKIFVGVKPAAPAMVGFGELAKGQNLLPGKGELVERGVQMLGPARIADTWTQTIFHPDGHVLYGAGQVFDEPPKDLLPRLNRMEGNKAMAEAQAIHLVPEISRAAQRYPAILEVRKTAAGTFEPYWRIEFLDQYQEQAKYLFVAENGQLLETGNLSSSGADGRARVYPKGPKLSALAEETISGLTGDGLLDGERLHVYSALGLNVQSPDLSFIFPVEDRRFDLPQVYFTMDMGLRWMREHLDVVLNHPIDIKLHIGKDGISNAAFYDHNTVYLGTGDGVLYRDILRDPSVLVHESIHAIIDSYVGLPPDGEGGSYNEGFADLFAAIILDNPRLGEVSWVQGPYRRTLEHDHKAYRDFTNGVYNNGSIIAATFWDLRPILGDDKLAKLAFKTLVRLGKGAKFQDFVPSLVSASAGLLNTDEQNLVLEKVRNRGWVTVQ